jgi:hypothetical protein
MRGEGIHPGLARLVGRGGQLQLFLSRPPPAGRSRRLRQSQVDTGPSRGFDLRADEPTADRERGGNVAGLRRHLSSQLVDIQGQPVAFPRQLPGPRKYVDGARQRSPGGRPTGSCQQQPGRVVHILGQQA